MANNQDITKVSLDAAITGYTLYSVGRAAPK